MRNRYIIVTAILGVLALLSGQAFADRDGDDDNDCKSGRNRVRSVHSSRSNDGDDHKCTGSSSVNSSSNSGTTSRTKLKARLTSALQTGAYGKVEFETKTNSTEFESEVKIPVPSSSLGIADSTAAQGASVSLSLLRGGVEYASCDLDVKKAYTTRAEYKSDVISYRGATPVARFGDCVNGSGAIVVPSVQVGDTVEIFVDTYASGPFISGVIN